MTITFVSNYINHHQIPFCNAMSRLTDGDFTFVQTEPMEEQRVRMGWDESDRPGYVHCFYEEEAYCRERILGCDMAIFGGTDEESYIVPRLEAGKPVFRYSERLYKTGQWKAISPRGLRKKYHDHTRYRNAPVYLLCAGAYVASDFHVVRAYPGKMFCWGYFPETRRYDIDRLLEQKGYGEQRIPYLLWAARMIDWKHPELALETARHLRQKGIAFHMDLIGDGELHPRAEAFWKENGLEAYVTLQGYQPPEAVRGFMEKADIFLFTSDRQEGWGAVANEAMNSACAVVADHMIGSAPFLVRSGENGYLYKDGDSRQLFGLAERLAQDRALCRRLGANAYRTITDTWNAENAAERLMELMTAVMKHEDAPEAMPADIAFGAPGMIAADIGGSAAPYAPCMPAPVLNERYKGMRLK